MAAVLAVDGVLIQSGPATVLVLPAAAHALAAGWAFLGGASHATAQRLRRSRASVASRLRRHGQAAPELPKAGQRVPRGCG